jgi:hypothetical protein
MAVAKKSKIVKKVSKKPRAIKLHADVPVRGSDPLFSIPFTPQKKVSAKKRTPQKQKTEDPRPMLRSFVPIISISIDDQVVAKAAKYAGLVCICIGACFSAYALGGVYVQTASLSLSGGGFSAHMRAAVASNPLFTLQADEVATSSVHQVSSSTTTQQTATSSLSHDTSLDSVMQPPALLSIKNPLHLKGVVSLGVTVDPADGVSLYVRKEGSLTDVYLNSAVRASDTLWNDVFDARTLPNGNYTLFVRVKNQYGVYNSRLYAVAIENSFASVASSSPAVLQHAQDMKAKVDAVVNEFRTTDPQHDLRAELISFTAQVATGTPATTSSGTSTQGIHSRQLAFINDIDGTFKHLLEMYAIVLRAKDPSGSERMMSHITEFKRQTLDRLSTDLLPGEQSNTDVIQNLRDRINTIITSEAVRTKKQEDLIALRVGDQLSVDTDHDGIVDYDELTLYHTDPLNADTDGDGYPDGAELLAGYDPNKADGPVLRVFEDPRSSGISRPDILDISAANVQHATTSGPVPEKILFTGKGLPNSFVTIYIYSTPITAITKTDANGLWSYVLDAALDDGQHQAYVALSDNTGLLVAKSLPFFFIKDAGMYTLGTLSQKTMATLDEPDQPLSEYAYMLIASFVVLTVGLLMLVISIFMTHHHHLRSVKRSQKTKVASA